jgi:hypothetical protein
MFRRLASLLLVAILGLALVDPAGSGRAWAQDPIRCGNCHIGGELSGLTPLDGEPGIMSGLSYQPCPGLRSVFRERYLLESRLANLTLLVSEYGEGAEQSGPLAATLTDVSGRYRELLAAPMADGHSFAAAAVNLRRILDREVYWPMVRRRLARKSFMFGGLLLSTVSVLIALVWVRYLPWRRRFRGQELLLDQARGGRPFHSGRAGENHHGSRLPGASTAMVD